MNSYGAGASFDTQYLCPFDAAWEEIAAGQRDRSICRRGAGERWPVSIPILVFCRGRSVQTVTRDLSRSGCAVEASPGRVGDTAIVSLQWGDSRNAQALTLAARCIHKSTHKVGLQFGCIADTDRLMLAEAMDWTTRQGTRPGNAAPRAE